MHTHQASRTPRDLPGSGWYEILPEPDAVRVLDASLTADWVIVGAGFAGLSAAKRLDQLVEGAHIVIVDAQRVGWGASGRNSGFMIDLPHELQSEDYASGVDQDRKQIELNRAAIAFASAVVADYDMADFWEAGGKINAATDGAGMQSLRSYAGHLQQLDEPAELLDAQQMQEITGIDYYAGGLLTPGCVQIQPAAYIRGLARGMVNSNRNCIEIFENAPVVKICSGADCSIEVDSAGGRHAIHAGRIILTVNGHLASFGFYQKHLMHVFTFASMTRELDRQEVDRLGGRDSWGVTPAHPMGSTVRRIRQNRIVIRNTFTFNPDMQTSQKQVDKLGRKHDRSFTNRFPMLPDVSMEYRWGGHLCLSLNSVPIFGELEKNLFVSCCQNGLGTVKGTLGGMLIAELANGEANPMIDALLQSAPPKKLPPDPLLTVGARTKLWWSQSRAGRDC